MNLRPRAGDGAVDFFFSLFAGMIAREELPPEREKSLPIFTTPAPPVDCSVVSPLLLRGPQTQQAPVPGPPADSAGQPAGGGQKNIGQPLPANLLRAGQDVLDAPGPPISPRVMDPPGEIAFAVRLVRMSSEASPPAQPVMSAAPESMSPAPEQTPIRADGASPAMKNAGAPPEGILNPRNGGPAPSPDLSCDNGAGQPRAAAPLGAQTRANDSASGHGDTTPPSRVSDLAAQAPVPGLQSLPHSGMAPHDAQRTGTPATITLETAPAAPAHPHRANEITVRLATDDAAPVDIRLIDRAGAVRVAVRTADTHLARTMQAGLSELVNGLEHNGYAAEIWSPSIYGSGSHDANTPGRRQHLEQGGGAFEQPGGGHHQPGQGGNGKPDGRHRPQWVLELAGSIGRQEKEYRS